MLVCHKNEQVVKAEIIKGDDPCFTGGMQRSQTFIDMQRSLKKRCWADQNSLDTSRLCPVSSTASLKAPLRSCNSPYGVVLC